MTYQHQSISTLGEYSTNKVLRNTYALLSMTLGFSAVTSAIAMYMEFSRLAGLGFSILGLVLVFVVIKTAHKAAGLFWVFAFTGVMGLSLGPMLSHFANMPNGASVIMQAMTATAVIFMSLSAYAVTTKKDFSFMGGFLFVGLIVVLLAAIANIFLAMPVLQLVISSVIVLLMAGYILYDTSSIINGGETNYIRATVSLYLNIFNLFTALLQLFGFLNSDD